MEYKIFVMTVSVGYPGTGTWHSLTTDSTGHSSWTSKWTGHNSKEIISQDITTNLQQMDHLLLLSGQCISLLTRYDNCQHFILFVAVRFCRERCQPQTYHIQLQIAVYPGGVIISGSLPPSAIPPEAPPPPPPEWSANIWSSISLCLPFSRSVARLSSICPVKCTNLQPRVMGLIRDGDTESEREKSKLKCIDLWGYRCIYPVKLQLYVYCTLP